MSADPKLQIPFTFKAAAAVAAVGFNHTTVVTSRIDISRLVKEGRSKYSSFQI
jgi:hypothetical protein